MNRLFNAKKICLGTLSRPQTKADDVINWAINHTKCNLCIVPWLQCTHSCNCRATHKAGGRFIQAIVLHFRLGEFSLHTRNQSIINSFKNQYKSRRARAAAQYKASCSNWLARHHTWVSVWHCSLATWAQIALTREENLLHYNILWLW